METKFWQNHFSIHNATSPNKTKADNMHRLTQMPYRPDTSVGNSNEMGLEILQVCNKDENADPF
ncbi:hypothetical protein CCACVL1_17233 [Corchorus capsularis]|uniref:Uncharacterized protein n=1 Tax=Corchorus capsularis TaxID=210143 RepID=A0A1R3HT86_COCAP|nr:hypothetical protein CCACVL1_17233 [Corchorus capsularis]